MKKTKPNNYRKGRPVDIDQNPEDRECLILLLRGRSNAAIMKDTGLSQGQITYRANLFEVKRMDYRNGTSLFAKAVDKATEGIAEKALLQHLRTHVGKG
jgi:hypothetical protein